MIHIFEIPDPNFPIHFITFGALGRKLSHVIGKNSFFPIVKATKFTAYEQYHMTCAKGGGSPKPHVTITRPRLVYSLYNFYGSIYDDD